MTQKKAKKNATTKKKAGRPLFQDAAAHKRGTFECDDAIVRYGQSLIPEAGNGVFAVVDLKAGDIVTQYEGAYMKEEPNENAYTMTITPKELYLDGI